MMFNSTTLSLRAKKLGALIADARLAARKNIEECSAAIRIPVSTYESYERGESSPSLPELELLAYYLKVPIEHFWGKQSLSAETSVDPQWDVDKLVRIRNRMIGARLRMARSQSGISLEELAQQSGLAVSQIEAYELGQVAIPLPLFDALNEILGVPVKEYLDKNGPIGQWFSQQQILRDFLEMPTDLQAFVVKPVNRPYIELAVRLSGMSVDQLRAVAEGLLEITL
jgi:transcriptional regulator with XRE-family HTH domain